MQLLLDDIADVRTGLTLRGADAARRTVEEGPHYLRISDLSEDGGLVITETQPIDPALDPDLRHRVARCLRDMGQVDEPVGLEREVALLDRDTRIPQFRRIGRRFRPAGIEPVAADHESRRGRDV